MARQTIDAIVDRCECGETAAADLLDEDCLADAAVRRLVRVRMIPALRSAGDLPRLARMLQLWLRAEQGRASDWLLLAATQRKLGREDCARSLLEQLVNQHPDDPAVMAAAMQQAMQQGRNADAARIADTFAGWRDVSERTAQLGMAALLRDGKPDRAIALGKACTAAASGPLNAALAEAYMALDNPVLAVRHAQRAIASGHDTAGLRLLLASAASARFEPDRAIAHLDAAIELNPDNVRALANLGELLLIRRRPKAASIHLQRALSLAPDLVNLRILLARAYKEQRNYAAAATECSEILRREPHNPHHRRQAAAIYRLANRPEEAARLLRDGMAARKKSLPASLAAGLAALWDRTDEAAIPVARLDWAWGMRATEERVSRAEWDRRARWGWLADRLLQDWLETSPDRAEEAMFLFADLGSVAKTLENAARSYGGLILATAHIGPLFAGPLALQLLDLRCNWLASTPSIDGMAYSDALISTSDQSETQVVRSAMASLDAGISLGIAVDGAMTMAAPRVHFEGQEVTYSSFAARLAHRRRSRGFFVAPQWQDGHLAFDLTELPCAMAGESLEHFMIRWREEWFAILRRLLRGAPENLRLSGGIWRHIRPASRISS